jgi:hypothetical protein
MHNEVVDNTPVINPLVEWVNNFEQKVSDVDKKVGQIAVVVNSSTADIRTTLGRVIRSLESKMDDQGKASVEYIKNIITAIEGMDIRPEVKSDPVYGENMEMVIRMLNDIKAELSKPKSWVHVIERDSDKFINKILSSSV